MMSATIATHAASSKKSRKSQPTNVAAPSLANDAAASQPATENATLNTRKAIAAHQRQRARLNGSNNPTVANTAGMTNSAITATSHHTDKSGSRLWNAK